MITRATTCTRDCPDACRILADVHDGRVTALRGDPDHPVTQGFLCHRTAQYLGRQYAADRVIRPLVRNGDGFEQVSWDVALDLIAQKMRQIRAESGPAAIFHYLSGGSLGLLQGVVGRFWQAFGPVTVKRGDICSGAGDAAQMLDFGVEDSNDIHDLLNSRCIVLWGKNPAVSGPHLMPILRQARARGCKVVLVDPVHHKTVGHCDAYVQVRPGGDFALAMAVARVLFERRLVSSAAAAQCDNLSGFQAMAQARSLQDWCRVADVSPSVAEGLAHDLANGPSNIQVGWGMGRRGIGGAIVRALDALCTLSGNLRVAGGGVSFYYKRRGAFDSAALHLADPPRTICEPLFGREVLAAADPPIRMVWVTAGNPVAMLPASDVTAQALRSREFVVVADSWMSDTARLAHVVLPAATLLETDDLVGAYGHHYLGSADAVVPPAGEARTDLQIVQALADRLGLAEVVAGSPEAWRQRLIAATIAPLGVGLDGLRSGYVRNPLAPKVLFADQDPRTPTGRVQLPTEAADDPADDPDHPLRLMSLSTEKSQSSQWVRPQAGPAECTVHPDAAAGIADGGRAWLRSAIGRIEVRVRCDLRQRCDVAIVPKGGSYLDGRAANALVRARLTDIGEGGALYDEGVRLEPMVED
ncbi:MAG: molybdopterin-dependent oxidoreductase [Deltaproteobacteria bacterium]|nr:molybdopterin-dependent oxidoreductase [Deltaproteobacteria bacterium]